jgi:hypothetical protein
MSEHYPWCHRFTGYVVEKRFEQNRHFEIYKCDNCGAPMMDMAIEILPAHEYIADNQTEEVET